MKNLLIIFTACCLMYSCNENTKEVKAQEKTVTDKKGEASSRTIPPIEDLKVSTEQLNGSLDSSDNNETTTKPEVKALDKLIEMSGVMSKEEKNSTVSDYEKILSVQDKQDLLELSGLSKGEISNLINKPDSLQILGSEKIKKTQLDHDN